MQRWRRRSVSFLYLTLGRTVRYSNLGSLVESSRGNSGIFICCGFAYNFRLLWTVLTFHWPFAGFWSANFPILHFCSCHRCQIYSGGNIKAMLHKSSGGSSTSVHVRRRSAVMEYHLQLSLYNGITFSCGLQRGSSGQIIYICVFWRRFLCHFWHNVLHLSRITFGGHMSPCDCGW